MRIVKSRGGRNGFATLIVIMMLSLMVALLSANLSGLFQLKREVRLLQKKHDNRWAGAKLKLTNSTSVKQP